MGTRESELLSSVRKAQEGDEEARNLLIQAYTPFILKIAAATCGRYLKVGEDDEASIAMIAFNEAINNYDQERNVSFLSFSEILIKRRLIDHYRKENKGSKVIPLSSLEDREGEGDIGFVTLAQRQAAQLFQEQREASERRAEILQFTQILKEFGISFRELVQISPRHEDARVRAIEVAFVVAGCREYRNHLLTKKELPLKKLEKHVKVSRRTLERQRKYIIAVALILIYDLAYLKEYLAKPSGMGGGNDE
ncbi:MAG: RNA polymerase sigma-I factor [Bacillota bacterium]|jgi:RNA polymerase sigma factor|nr:RNA polymerase sigma-I factor [Bacillota bacterium]